MMPRMGTGRGVDERSDIVLVMTDQQRFDQMGYASRDTAERPRSTRSPATASCSTPLTARRRFASRRAALGAHRSRSASATDAGKRTALARGLDRRPHLPRRWVRDRLIGKMQASPRPLGSRFRDDAPVRASASQGLGALSRARNDVVDDYHDWLFARGEPDWRFEHPTNKRVAPTVTTHPTTRSKTRRSRSSPARSKAAPFLVMSFPHPHAPYDPPEPYASMYDPADSVLPSDGYEVNERASAHVPGRDRGVENASRNLRPGRVRGFLQHRARFDPSDRRHRRAPRRAVDLDSTVVFFTSDHGDYSGHRGLMRKDPWIPFDDLARVPFLAVGRDIAGGRRVGSLVQSFDFTLTALDFAGVAQRQRSRLREPKPARRTRGRAGVRRSRPRRALRHDLGLPDDPARNSQVPSALDLPM